MAITLSVNASNDIFIDDIGNLATSLKQQTVLEACEQAMQALRGEMFYASTRGMPHFEVSFSGSPNVVQFEAAGRVELNAVSGVTAVDDFEAVVVNNIMQYSATIETAFGTSTITGVVSG